MNTENNKRYMTTEENILNAYNRLASSKRVDQITVSDICRTAGIHRTSFYGHFQDIHTLQSKVDALQMQKLLDCFMQGGTWNLKEGLQMQLQFFYENRSILKKNLRSEANENRFVDFLSGQMTDRFKESFQKRFHSEDEIELNYQKEFLTMGTLAILKKWILSDCQESYEKIAKILYSLYVAPSDAD